MIRRIASVALVLASLVSSKNVLAKDGMEAPTEHASSQRWSPPDFVKVAGRQFKLNGKSFYFQGTNLYEIGLLSGASEYEVAETMRQMKYKGIKVVRIWGFANGSWNGTSPLQWSPLHFNGEGLRRMDWALAKAAENDIKVIFVFSNFEDEYGGIQWWVNQKLGSGNKELFYTDWSVRQAFQDYMKAFIYRQNGVNGRIYRDDPTIMAWELMNEPHTSDNYERNRGQTPGTMVYNWLWEMANFVKQNDPNHLVSSGEEGFLANKPTDRYCWLGDGHKGADYQRNIQIPYIDFATLHIYPDKWEIPYHDRYWIRDSFLSERIRIAQDVNYGQGKPVVLEEYGFQRWYGDRDQLFREIHDFVNSKDIAGTMVWRMGDRAVDDWSYEFDFGDSGYRAVTDQAHYMNSR